MEGNRDNAARRAQPKQEQAGATRMEGARAPAEQRMEREVSEGGSEARAVLPPPSTLRRLRWRACLLFLFAACYVHHIGQRLSAFPDTPEPAVRSPPPGALA